MAALILVFARAPALSADTLAQTNAASTAAQQAALQQQLQALEAQIAQDQQQLSGLASQKNTLANKLRQLKAQQAQLGLQIQAANLQISNLATQISATQAQIFQNTAKISQLNGEIGQFLLLIDEHDSQPIVYTLASSDSFADAWAEVSNEADVSSGLVGLVGQAQTLNAQLSAQEATLSQQQDDASNQLGIQTLEQSQLVDTASQQSALIRQTGDRESSYQAVIKDTQAQAAQISSRLYALTSVTGSNQIDFGQAVQIADAASVQTGVRAAFLLAILTQESDLGKNVGTCNRAGDPPSKSWRVVMKPSRDQQPFVAITQSFGLDTDTTPVSCPMHDAAGNQVGWGGAMGPAQFIPSTWVGYEAQVSTITGKPANPWDISDAFLAAAIKLKAGGAGTQSGEWAAAMRYFSGGTNPAYSFYGDSVVAKAAQYQSDIANLGT